MSGGEVKGRGVSRGRQAGDPRGAPGRPQLVTLPLGGHLTGHVGHIAVEAGPAAVALTPVQGAGLPALATVLAGGGVAPAHEALGAAGGARTLTIPPTPPGPTHLSVPSTHLPEYPTPGEPTLQTRKLRPGGCPSLCSGAGWPGLGGGGRSFSGPSANPDSSWEVN